MKFVFIAIAAILSAGCTERFEISVDRLSVVRSEPSLVHSQPPEYGIKIPSRGLSGMLRLDVSTDFDMYNLEKEKDLNLWYSVNTCESKIITDKWPEIYLNAEKQRDVSDSRYRYSVFFEYQGKEIFKPERNYNLIEEPESLCVQFVGGSMAPFDTVRSNVVVIDKAEVIKVLEGIR